MKKSRTLLAATGSLAALALLAGCSTSTDKKVDYRGGASVSNQLEVPPDLVAPTRSDRYSVPGNASLSNYNEQRRVQGNQDKVEVLPKVSDNMHIERAGSQRWLVVPGTPETVWPKLRNFFLEQGLPLKVDKPDIGIMETDWAENHPIVPNDGDHSLLYNLIGTFYSSGIRDKYRVRVENGKTPDTVEIYLTHRGLKETYTDDQKRDTKWVPTPPDPDLETEMLRLVMVKMGADEDAAKQIADKPQDVGEHARIQTNGDGSLQLSVDEQQDRAWRQIGLALDRVGLVVEDRDRSKNTYYVRYVVTEDAKDANGEDSWLSRMFGSKDTLGTSLYQIVVQPNSNNTIVRVLDKDGNIVQTDAVRQILNLLYNELK